MYSKLSFTCNKCQYEINEEVFIPDTNMEDNEGSYSEDALSCQKCGKTFSISVNNRGGLALVTIDGIPFEQGLASTPDIVSDYYTSDEENQLYEDFLWYSSISQQIIYQYFSSSIGSIKSMLNLNIRDRHQVEMLYRMLFVQCISSMEAYLSSTLISRVIADPKLLIKMVEIDRVLKKETYSLAAILKDKDLPKKRANKYLSELMYHNLPKVEFLYKSLLEIEFDFGRKNGKKQLILAIQTRHDCVYRNGKTREGGELQLIDKEYLLETIDIIEKFIFNIEGTLEEYDEIPF